MVIQDCFDQRPVRGMAGCDVFCAACWAPNSSNVVSLQLSGPANCASLVLAFIASRLTVSKVQDLLAQYYGTWMCLMLCTSILPLLPWLPYLAA